MAISHHPSPANVLLIARAWIMSKMCTDIVKGMGSLASAYINKAVGPSACNGVLLGGTVCQDRQGRFVYKHFYRGFICRDVFLGV